LVRRGLFLFVLLLTFDGAFRKWAFPAAEQLIFVAKDGLIAALFLYAGFFRQTRSHLRLPTAVHLSLSLYIGYVLIEGANPALPNLLVGFWGIKAHILYASLIVLVPAAVLSLSDLYASLARLYPLVCLPVCFLAFAQIIAPADSIINQQVRGGLEGIATFGDAGIVRVAGTFSYLSGMAAFVEVAVLLGVVLFLAGARGRLFLAAFGSSIVALPLTGSRAVIAVTVVGGLIVLVAGALNRSISVPRFASALIIIGALLVVSVVLQDAAWEAFQQRFDNSFDEGIPRIFTAFTNAFQYFDVSGLSGYGSGAANLGAPALAPDGLRFYWLPVGADFEEESGRLVLELGMLGWGLSVLMRTTLLLWALRLTFQGRSSNCRLAGLLALPFMALGVQQGSGVFAPSYSSVFYWASVGVMALAEYEHRAADMRDALRATRAAPNTSRRAPPSNPRPFEGAR
jgi:hypothetical protein